MDTGTFKNVFWEHFGEAGCIEPRYDYWDPIVRMETDLCPDVEGMLSLKKQQLLNMAFRFLGEDESYLEVGTYQGKSLLSAMINNPARRVYACDNFSLFDENSLEILQANLARYGFGDITFYDRDFLEIFTKELLPEPVGLYFYDGAHDYDSQYEAIKRVEPFLSNEALVLVDDWRFARDSGSYAKEATMKAVEESEHAWELLIELPARFNGDQAMWWNGVAMLAFNRTG